MYSCRDTNALNLLGLSSEYRCVPHSCSPWHSPPPRKPLSPLYCLGKCISGFSLPVLVIYRLQIAPLLPRLDSFTPASSPRSYMPTHPCQAGAEEQELLNSLRSTTWQADPHLL